MVPSDALPWERQNGETPRAWDAFVIFRDMGPHRSMREMREKLPARSVFTLNCWRTGYQWIERAARWDAHLDVVRRRAAEQEVVKMGERHAMLAMAIQSKLADKLRNITAADIPTGGIANWLKIAVEVERMAREVGTTKKVEITGAGGGPVELRGYDLKKLSTAELETMVGLMDRLAGGAPAEGSAEE